jgi:hypothetical protein
MNIENGKAILSGESNAVNSVSGLSKMAGTPRPKTEIMEVRFSTPLEISFLINEDLRLS